MRPCVIWNRQAGSKAGIPTNAIDERHLRELLARHGLGEDIVATDTEEAARRAVRAAIDEGRRPVIAAGGDGTAYLVANSLAGTDIPLGILPLGSAMNLARSLGIPRDLDHAAAIVAAGRARPLDIGDAGGRPFHECVTIGLGAEVLARAHALDKGRWGAIPALVRVLRGARRRRISLRLDDRPINVHAMAVVVANGPFTGLGLAVAPDARRDDGLLDVLVFNQGSRLELVRQVWSIALRGRSARRQATRYQARAVSVDTVAVPCRADDFDLGHSPLEIGVRPAAVRVLAP